MDSPFPGMDPYLERFWNDVHGKFVPYIADELNVLLPSRFRAAMQERVLIADVERETVGPRYPDVALLEWPDAEEGGVATAVHSQHALLRSPHVLQYDVDPIKQYSIEILDSKSGEAVVTAIEVLSPENKRPGDGMIQFRRKQEEYRAAGVNRVEIDLLRAGKRLFDFPAGALAPALHKPYYVTVYRGTRPGEVEIYAIDLRDPLPTINVPLRGEHPDVRLALQPLMARVYRNGRFRIDYDAACEPPLEGDEAEWARHRRAAPAAGT